MIAEWLGFGDVVRTAAVGTRCNTSMFRPTPSAAISSEPADRSAIQDVVEPEPEHPQPDVVLGQVHQLAAGGDPAKHASEVYAALWLGALLAAAGELPDPFPPPIEELARRYFERFPPNAKA